MTNPIEQALAIVSDRGDKLRQTDLDDITLLMAEVPLAQSEAVGHVMGAVALIVNDPEYAGDIEPFD